MPHPFLNFIYFLVQSFFKVGSCTFCHRLASYYNPPTYILQCNWNHRQVPHLAIDSDWVLTNFLPKLALNHTPPIFISRVDRLVPQCLNSLYTNFYYYYYYYFCLRMHFLIVELLYSLLYGGHNKHFQVLDFLPFPIPPVCFFS
jgi:hypothetical protein